MLYLVDILVQPFAFSYSSKYKYKMQQQNIILQKRNRSVISLY